jgi:hypothetical protein
MAGEEPQTTNDRRCISRKVQIREHSPAGAAECRCQANAAVPPYSYVVVMELFFPVSERERDALLEDAGPEAELAGLGRIEWDAPGVAEDAIWVAADVSGDVARRYEEPDSDTLGYRSFVLPSGVLRTLTWRVVPATDITAAAKDEADRAAAWRTRARRRD